MEQTFTVHDFARLAGVSVRTLHYYDQSGLLVAQRRGGVRRRGARSTSTRKAAEFGVRQYRQADLLRLQQILTLKHLGFSLSEIRVMLDTPHFDVRAALAGQEQALSQQIAHLQGAVRALQIAQAHLHATGVIDWAQITAIIHAVRQAGAQMDWVRRFYSDAQLAAIYARARPGDAEAGTRAWEDLIAQFHAHRDLPLDHPVIADLARAYARLIDQFTGGDPAIAGVLHKMYSDPSQIPAQFRPYDDETQQFMRRAYEHYFQDDAQTPTHPTPGGDG